MEMKIEFFVPGHAKTQGSKKNFYSKTTGKPSIVDDNPLTKGWKATVSWYASRSMKSDILIEGPVRLVMTFWRERRSGDFRTSQGQKTGYLRSSADAFPIARPDSLKLGRAVEDALTGVVYKDDSQVCDHHIFKRYCDHGEQPGVNVVVEVMDNSLHGQEYVNDFDLRSEPTLFEPAR